MENNSEKSQTKIIASTNVFQIEFVEKLGKEDYPPLINISLHLAKEYGRQAVLTKNTIEKYFDGKKIKKVSYKKINLLNLKKFLLVDL